MVRYLSDAEPPDAAWAVYFLSGGRPKRLIPVRRLATWAGEAADVPSWLFEECYASVGDLAETIALLLPAAERAGERRLHEWVEGKLLPLSDLSEEEQRSSIIGGVPWAVQLRWIVAIRPLCGSPWGMDEVTG